MFRNSPVRGDLLPLPPGGGAGRGNEMRPGRFQIWKTIFPHNFGLFFFLKKCSLTTQTPAPTRWKRSWGGSTTKGTAGNQDTSFPNKHIFYLFKFKKQVDRRERFWEAVRVLRRGPLQRRPGGGQGGVFFASDDEGRGGFHLGCDSYFALFVTNVRHNACNDRSF